MPKTDKTASNSEQSKKPSKLPVDLLRGTVGFAINRAEIRCYQALSRRLPEGMSPARLTALSMIGSHPGINQTELAAMLEIANPNVVKVVNALESAGYVVRTAIDRRSYALSVTDAGLEEMMRFRRIIDECEEEMAQQLSAAERQMLISLLQRLAVEAE